MNEYLSLKLRILSFFSILGLMFTHGYFNENKAWPLNDFVQNMISFNLLKFRIPLFFMISGYLFFYSLPKLGIKGIKGKLISRYYSLLLPYIYWNIYFFVLMVLLKLIPFSEGYVFTDYASVVSLGDLKEILFVLFVKPAGFHYWFLQYLLLYVALSPVIYVAIKYFPVLFYVSLTVVFGVFLVGGEYLQSVLFFCIGAGVSFYRVNIDTRTLSVKWSWLFGFSFVVLSVLRSIELISWNSGFLFVFYLLGICSIWLLYDCVFKSKSIDSYFWLATLSSYNFFIYAFHEPYLNVLQKLLPSFLGKSQFAYLITYFINPIIMSVVCIKTADILKHYFPSLYGVLTGGRGLKVIEKGEVCN